MDGKSSDIRQEQIGKLRPKSFICLDRLFAGSDQLKTNTALQLSKIPLAGKDAGVEFRTV